MMRWMVGIWVVLMLGGADFARTTVELPLEGWFRAGRYMPVRVRGDGPMVIEGKGMVRTRVGVRAGPVDGVASVLVLSEQASGRAGGVELGALRALDGGQALVVEVGDAGGEFVTQRQAVRVRVDRSTLLGSAPSAWQCVDVLLLDSVSWERVGRDQMVRWLADGMAVGVRLTDRPTMPLAWKRVGDYWMVKLEMLGPDGAMAEPAGYGPTLAWSPGWSSAMRHAIVLAGAVFSLALMLVLLVRARWAIWGAVGVCAAAMIGFGWWRMATAGVFGVQGSVVVRHDGWEQRDVWSYDATRGGGVAERAFVGVTFPVGYARGHLEGVEMTLQCDAAGRPVEFVVALEAQNRLAFVSRTVELAEAKQVKEPAMDHGSPMARLARSLYSGRPLAPGKMSEQKLEVVGMTVEGGELGTVVMGEGR